jgi:hypothetical protein
VTSIRCFLDLRWWIAAIYNWRGHIAGDQLRASLILMGRYHLVSLLLQWRKARENPGKRYNFWKSLKLHMVEDKTGKIFAVFFHRLFCIVIVIGSGISVSYGFD